MELATTYMGLQLRNPLVASASPLSHTVEGVRRLADAGVGAVVLHSLFEEQLREEAARNARLADAGSESFAESLSYFPHAADENSGPRRELGAPDLLLTGSIDRVHLQRAIEQLPPGYRQVFVLHDVQGFEHNEIATLMSCSIGNSKSQLHKARMRLRELLQETLRSQAREERHAAKSESGGAH